MLVVTFDYTMWITMNKLIRISGIVNYITHKINIIRKKNILFYLRINIIEMAEFKPATEVRRLKILNFLDRAQTQSFCM
jgi:hypothetical protein